MPRGCHRSEIAKCLPGRSDNNVKNHWNSALRRMGASSTLKQGSGGEAFERRRAACEVCGCPTLLVAPFTFQLLGCVLTCLVVCCAQLLENYAKAYTREKQAEKERKQQGASSPDAPLSSGTKRRKMEKKSVVVPEPMTEAALKGVALGAAVAAQHPPLGPSPGSRKRRASQLTVQIGDEVQHVRSPPVSIPQSKGAPVGMPIDSRGNEVEEDEDEDMDSVTSDASNTFWQQDSEQDTVGELPLASHFSPITPFLPGTLDSESAASNVGLLQAPGLAVADERPTSAAGPEDAVPPSPFSFLWSPAVGSVRATSCPISSLLPCFLCV